MAPSASSRATRRAPYAAVAHTSSVSTRLSVSSQLSEPLSRAASSVHTAAAGLCRRHPSRGRSAPPAAAAAGPPRRMPTRRLWRSSHPRAEHLRGSQSARVADRALDCPASARAGCSGCQPAAGSRAGSARSAPPRSGLVAHTSGRSRLAGRRPSPRRGPPRMAPPRTRCAARCGMTRPPSP
eukprot:110733-Prymnesium_polylepis.1